MPYQIKIKAFGVPCNKDFDEKWMQKVGIKSDGKKYFGIPKYIYGRMILMCILKKLCVTHTDQVIESRTFVDTIQRR